jgi:hypothetical protein
MKEESKKLLIFLDKHFKKLNMNGEFSNGVNTLLSEIFERMKSAQEKIYETSFLKYSDVIENSNFDYMPQKIKDEIHQMNKTATVFEFKVRGRKFKINIIHYDMSSNKIHEFVKRIFMWFYIISFYAPTNCSQQLNINLYLTNIKKTLPTIDNTFIEQEHANTAFTTSCQQHTEINIFREEEWFKVLIHESFHCMGLDFSEFEQNDIDKKILKIFPIKSDVRLFETYCEMWGEIINVMFICYFSSKHKNIPTMISKSNKMLCYERVFSMFQCVKVLNHFNLKYKNLYEKTKNDEVIRKNYKEKTQIFSYYVLKCIYMYNLNEFIEWCNIHNNGSLNFDKSNENYKSNIHGYIGFIEKNYKKNDYLECLNKIEYFFLKRNDESFEMNTMRMSLFEM